MKLTSDLNIMLKARVRASISTLSHTSSILSFTLQSEAEYVECDMEVQLQKLSPLRLSTRISSINMYFVVRFHVYTP
jgi:hypothetical protein